MISSIVALVIQEMPSGCQVRFAERFEHMQMKGENKLGLLHLPLVKLLRNAGELSLHLVELVMVQHQELAVLQALNVVAALSHVAFTVRSRVDFYLVILIYKQLRVVDNDVLDTEVLHNPWRCINRLLEILHFVLALQLLRNIILLWVDNCEEPATFLHQERRYTFRLEIKHVRNVALLIDVKPLREDSGLKP